MTDKKLTPRESRFVCEFLKVGNAAGAAARAGYSKTTSIKLMRRPNIVAAIEAERKAQEDRLRADADELHLHLSAMLKADIAEIMVDVRETDRARTSKHREALESLRTSGSTLGSDPVTRSRMLSNGISAPSGLQCSQDSMSFSASRNVAGFTKTTFCSSGVGSKKSKNSGGMARILSLGLAYDSGITKLECERRILNLE